MPEYGRWLPGSEAFGRTTLVSPYPVRLGTTYLDAGPAGERPGSVTAFDRPKSIAFHQTMRIKRGPLTANCDIHIRCTLEPVEGGATSVIRALDLTIQIPGPLKVAEPLVASAFRKENARILAELKRYVEAQPTSGADQARGKFEDMSSEQPTHRKPPVQIPSDMNAFNQKVIEEFRANRGELSSGPLAGRHVMLLTTTGAKSGKERTAVLGFGKDGDRYVIIASGNGAPSHPAWYHNLQARPIATVEVGPDKFKVRARTARPEERDQLKPRVPYIEQQQTLTKREIPIVVLDRA